MRVGTRGSLLAIKQTQIAINELAKYIPQLKEKASAQIVPIKTAGDKIVDKTLSSFGGKGLFTKEIDTALLDGDIDIAVHSLKDMATTLIDGISMPCVLKREDPRDALVSLKSKNLKTMAFGSTFGTSSLRRGAQIKVLRPDIKVKPIRGNIQTRISKLEENVVDNTVLAYSGLIRNNMKQCTPYIFSINEMLPAVGQGVLAITCRQDDKDLIEKLTKANHKKTFNAIVCEREFLKTLDGSCKTPIAGYARQKGLKMEFIGEILLPDGSKHYKVQKIFKPEDAKQAGKQAALELIETAGEDFFQELKMFEIPEKAY